MKEFDVKCSTKALKCSTLKTIIFLKCLLISWSVCTGAADWSNLQPLDRICKVSWHVRFGGFLLKENEFVHFHFLRFLPV